MRFATVLLHCTLTEEAFFDALAREVGTLLGGGEYQGLVMALYHLVRDSLKVPGSLADLVRPDGHLDHVVLAHCPQWLGRRVVGGSSVLEQADCFLSWSQGVHHKAGDKDKIKKSSPLNVDV